MEVDAAGWNARLLNLSIGRASSVTEYKGNLYVISSSGDGVAIVDAATFTEIADSPIAYPSACNVRAYSKMTTILCVHVFDNAIPPLTFIYVYVHVG